MNAFVYDASPEEPFQKKHTTKMARNSDPTVSCLVYEFFQSQFALRNEVCPLKPEDYVNNDIMQSNDYRRISNVLRTQGQIYIQNYGDPINLQIETFLPGTSLASFNHLSNQIFHQGIDWNLILTYFVFSAELAHQANVLQLATVNDVAQWLTNYISEHLLTWVTENGGWNAIIQLDTRTNNSLDSHLMAKKFVYATAIGLISFGLFHLSKFLLRKCLPSNSRIYDQSSQTGQQVASDNRIIGIVKSFPETEATRQQYLLPSIYGVGAALGVLSLGILHFSRS